MSAGGTIDRYRRPLKSDTVFLTFNERGAIDHNTSRYKRPHALKNKMDFRGIEANQKERDIAPSAHSSSVKKEKFKSHLEIPPVQPSHIRSVLRLTIQFSHIF